ncbi:MAG: hypothetical protein ABJC12_08585 [Saprospiraceae bacterium]
MKFGLVLLIAFMTTVMIQPLMGQMDSTKVVDVVWLKDGSKLTGTILQWELSRGMTFRLITGAEIIIPKTDIKKVSQDIPLQQSMIDHVKDTYVRVPKPYAFKEKGWYQNSSGFFNFSYNGGAGIHHAMGYRFNRLLSLGIGTGIETHDFSNNRNIVPVYAEARGFFLAQKITPYYALKVGYGFALRDKSRGTTGAIGGFHLSPEVGLRFGSGDVSYYAGVEYKLQNATFSNQGFEFGGGTVTDKISYRRIEIRTGLLF